MKPTKLAALALALAVPFAAQAHKAWLLPSQTVLSGNDPWVTVDAAVSNDLFYFNHVPLRLDNAVITAPDGSVVQPQNGATGKFRSVFDVQLQQAGTYRIAVVNAGLFASWDDNGQPRRWRGNAESFKTEVPKDAKNLQVTQSAGRIETFVTNGAPSTGALKASNKGLELVPVTHPNDLFAGETATFQLLIDGAPAAGLELEVIPGGIRYRDAQNEIKATTDADGKFSVTWPEAGMYWLEASLQDDKASTPPATQRRASYAVTLEVLPQ
ncbi:DUF4198 domain-containing protein [Chiayiivirga flava]|uniref:Putative GH25 family protein n=1 Tax=Chiayiivirga flava TaxID=659595 RepID=A0A7W8D741_9GAMM|nr:DUF4198 domain-containing protein [Chiayiivirga flava]MBB5209129.1 putative GH25 family protein [Chiayiivirga flava]